MIKYIRTSDEVIRNFTDAYGYQPEDAIDVARERANTRNPEFYNPLIQAAYRSLASGASVQNLWDDAHGELVSSYPGQKQFNRAWQTFQKYDRNFNFYVSRFNDHFRKFTKEALAETLRDNVEMQQVDHGGWEDR